MSKYRLEMITLLIFGMLTVFADSYSVVIIGGGPSGLLSSISLARKGHTVNVYERLVGEPKSDNKSYNLILSERGTHALDRFDVEYMHKSVDVQNIIRHGMNGGTDSVKCQKSISINRGDLVECIRSTAEASGVYIHKSNFDDMDLKNKEVHLDTGTVGYDLLVGADGANSRVRSSLDTYVSRFSFKEERDDRIFKTFRVEKEDMERINGYEDSWNNGFHVWQGPVSELICPPTTSGGITGTFVTKSTFDHHMFPDVFGETDKNRIELLQYRTPKAQKYVYCSHLGIDDVILMGDAAHSMSASLGQGVNAALEDAVCLDRCMAINLHADEMVNTYNNCRVEDAHAVCDISKKAFGNGDRSERGFNVNKMMLYLGRSDISYSDILKFSST